jgi:hypothetical protein
MKPEDVIDMVQKKGLGTGDIEDVTRKVRLLHSKDCKQLLYVPIFCNISFFKESFILGDNSLCNLSRGMHLRGVVRRDNSVSWSLAKGFREV